MGCALTCALGRTCSFCDLETWELYFLGKAFLSSLIRDFFVVKEKRCKIECMFTCPRSKVLNTKVTVC